MSGAARPDVIVVGGGPAGSLVALDLARGGCRVVLFDGSHPRDKPCSGFLADDLFALHPAIAAFDRHAPFDGDRVYVTPRGRGFRVPGNAASTRFRLAARRDLDLFLVERAAQAGATWIREPVVEVARSGGGWRIRTPTASFGAPIVVGADGARSRVRRSILGPIGPADQIVGVGRRYEGRRADALRTAFLAGGGVGFVLPGRGFAQAAVAARLSRARRLSARLAAFLAAEVPAWTGSGTPWTGLQPSPMSPGFFRRACAGDDFCLVGDAAGHCDALNAEGIRFAVQGAIEAAGAILAGRPREYEDRWRARFGRRLERSSFLVRHAPGTWALEGLAACLARSPALVGALAEARATSPASAARLLARLPRIAREIVAGSARPGDA